MDIGQGTKLDGIKNEITAIDVGYNTDKVVYHLPGVFWWSSGEKNFKKQFHLTYVLKLGQKIKNNAIQYKTQ